MLDINYIKNNTEEVKVNLGKRGIRPLLVDRLLEQYESFLLLKAQGVLLNQKRNEFSKEHTPENAAENIRIKEELRRLTERLRTEERIYKELLLDVPNLVEEDVPRGGEEKNEIVKSATETKNLPFRPKDHLELGEDLDIIDTERAAKVSGSRFGYLKGDGALLELALINHATKKLVDDGFTLVFPPALIRKEITEGLGYWHGGGNENYYLVHDVQLEGPEKGQELPLYLVGTGEHSIVPMHKDEIFLGTELPKRYAAFSSCFRREAGSYGRDTKGIIRVHQFDKLEMVSFVPAEQATAELEKLLSFSEGLMKDLNLPYQIVKLAAGDLGFPSAKTYDIETWLPSQGRFRETHSISTTTDYQARRLGIKYKDRGGKNEYIHILNGTAFAMGRTIACILENNQQEDGSVVVPEVLRPYLGKDKISKQ